MSILLFGAGALAFMAGVAMVGFGIPINEFSFGNTLIVSGTVAIVGGLVIVGLGAAVLYLQRIADALANKAPVRASRPFDTFEQPARAPERGTGARSVPAQSENRTEGRPAAARAGRLEPFAEPPLATPPSCHDPECRSTSRAGLFCAVAAESR